ncbi:MAG: SpoIID/LytB domain-containing protein, partial [Elusimicrobiota bacterium]|nr:SpoIID/LytB domain-containing protein [Elusimicrobiota bacterium]
DAAKAAEAFERAVKRSSTSAELAFDAAIALEEAGQPERALPLYARAAELSPDAEKETALAMALLRQGRAAEAAQAAERALARAPDDPWVLLAAGRAKAGMGRWDEAAGLLARASDAAPGLTPADFYLGRALEAKGDGPGAAEAYRKAVAADSYFNEGRGPLTQAYLRLKRYNEAMRQLLRMADAEPGSKLTRAMIDKIRPLMTRTADPRPEMPSFVGAPAPRALTETEGAAPLLRVGVATSPLGRVRPRRAAGVKSGGAWKAFDPKTGRILLSAEPDETWTARIVIRKTKKNKKGRALLELHGPGKNVAAAPNDAVLLKLDDPQRSVFELDGVPEREGWTYRGELEIALHGGRRSLRLVNLVRMEDYTHGVVSAEMPNRSPLEALKAQAIMARTHVYYLKLVHRFRHKKEGYDICDEQHCQVYAGVRAETERTRAVVEATRGLVATYNGRPAQVIYSSHCGGHTQSGKEVGWGDVPYWKAVSDASGPASAPRSPAELRRALARWPPEAFCRPSAYVHASHTRWTRVVPAKTLEEKLARKLKIGKLKGLRVLRRARSGHVNALLVVGSRRSVKLTDELDIRSLLGVGSLRSTLFVVDAEYKPEPSFAPKTTIGPAKGRRAPRPAPVKLQLDAFVFRGGGWGHGVGFCQSGAMGRAEAGQDYETIIKTYFPGIGLSRLDY